MFKESLRNMTEVYKGISETTAKEPYRKCGASAFHSYLFRCSYMSDYSYQHFIYLPVLGIEPRPHRH